jgi:hypothetical protein
MQQDADIPDSHDWRVESLRLTAFLRTPLATPPDSWWPELAGGQTPENEINRPREGMWQLDGSVAHPGLRPATLTLRGQDRRLDCVLQAAPTGEPPFDPSTAYLASYPDALNTFLSLVRNWITAARPDATRLALGIVLTLPVPTRQDGYAALSSYLPFPIEVDSTDFLYRINRPTRSQALADGTTLNRLSTWAVVQFDTLVVSIQGGQSTAQALSSVTQPFLACRLELDISTAADRSDPIPPDQFDGLLTEFAATVDGYLAPQRTP